MVRGVSEINVSIFLDSKSGYNCNLFPKIFENKKLFEILLHALPALEELVLGTKYWKDWDVAEVIVSSASLKTLTINSSVCLDTLSFDTPSLVYLCYSDYVVRDYSVAKMENLFDARISLLASEEEITRARGLENDLMNGIRNVQYLVLSPNTLEVLSLCCESMPVFKNLKSLTIKSEESRGWQAMPVLLRNCPHLETLLIILFEFLFYAFRDRCGMLVTVFPENTKVVHSHLVQ
ncbi:unnamed protein product [Arabidopsis halleri]